MSTRALVIALVLGCATASHANPNANAVALVQEADLDFKLARFDDALAKYTHAYELFPTPPLLFNIGQCHRQLKHHDLAVHFFRQYLQGAPSSPNAGVVEGLIQEETDAAAADQRRADELAKAQARVVATHVDPPPTAVSIVDTPRPRSKLLAWSLIGGGAALAVAGGVYYYYGAKRGPDEKYIYSDTRLLGGALIVGGAASAAIGTYLWLRPTAAVTPGGIVVGMAGSL
jgi:tetratricopeptide (TPR) repeat protein